MLRAIVACLALAVAPLAGASQLIVLCPGAVQRVVAALVPALERDLGTTVKLVPGTAGSLAQRAQDGEAADVVISTASAVRKLAGQGRVHGDGIAELGAMGVGVAVRKGAPTPDIGTPEAFRKTMLEARSVMYADPAKGGQSGIHAAEVMRRLGIADAMQPKTRLRPGAPVGLQEVARGDIDIGIGQVSEILAEPGVVLVGPLPGALQNEVMFAAAVMTASTSVPDAQRFVQRLTDAPARAAFRAAGFRVP